MTRPYLRSAALIEVLEGLGLRPETDTSRGEKAYNVHYHGEVGNDIRYAATRRSCSPRASGRSASTEVSP